MKIEDKNILFVGAHPDDIEIGCAGIIDAIKDSNNIRCLILSQGENGGKVENRRIEQLKANELLYLSSVVTLGLPDGNIAVTSGVFSLVELNINQAGFYPDIIFVHSPKDTHQDHRATAEIIRSICYRKNIDLIFYDSFSSYDFEPNFYVPIDWDKKMKVLSQFESQIERCPEIISKCNIKAMTNGFKCNRLFAEGFRIDKISL